MEQHAVSQIKAILPQEYPVFLGDIKKRVLSSQVKAALSVNSRLISLYWEIGSKILSRQQDEGWGAKIIDQLSKDLKSTFPNMKGFSKTNIKYMVQFAKSYPQFEIGQQAVGQIPWSHNIILLQKLKTVTERLWYAKKAIERGWSRAILQHWIDSNLYNREGQAVHNFEATLPNSQSDLAIQVLKDPYCFDFLTDLTHRGGFRCASEGAEIQRS